VTVVRWIVDNPFSADLPVWTRSYVVEMSPGPLTPLSWDLFWGGPAVQGWRDAMIDRMGFRSDDIGASRPELIGCFGGFAYLNASFFRIWAARMPALAPNHIDTAYLAGQHDLPGYVPAQWHQAADITSGVLSNWLGWVLVDQNQSELEAGRLLSLEAAANRPALAELSDGELVEHALSLQPLCRVLLSQHLNQTLAASIGPSIIAAICDDIGLPTIATKLISGLGEIESVSPARVLWTLSRQVRVSMVLTAYFDAGLAGLYRRLHQSETVDVVGFLAGLDALLVEVGFRGGDDWSLDSVSWETDPGVVLGTIDRMRRCDDEADPTRGFARCSAERELLVIEIGDVVAANPVAKDHFDAAVAATRTFIRGRDRAKANVTRVVHEIRLALAELAGRALSRGDVAEARNLHMLFADELAYYADGGLAQVREITDERRAHFDQLSSLEAPPLIEAPRLIEAPPSPTVATPRAMGSATDAPLEPGEVLFGKPGSFGVSRGRARIVSSAAQANSMNPGDVMVVSITSPSWASLFVGAEAVVIEQGSVLSHAAVAGRELGIPTVVAAKGATTRIPEGSMIEVDGVTGIVTVVEGPAAAADDHEPREMAIDPWGSRSHDSASW
jgi:rifampicin phosphotransferase